MPLVPNPDIGLSPEAYPSYTEFYTERFLINGFEIARAERTMHLDCRTNDRLNESL